MLSHFFSSIAYKCHTAARGSTPKHWKGYIANNFWNETIGKCKLKTFLAPILWLVSLVFFRTHFAIIYLQNSGSELHWANTAWTLTKINSSACILKYVERRRKIGTKNGETLPKAHSMWTEKQDHKLGIFTLTWATSNGNSHCYKCCLEEQLSFCWSKLAYISLKILLGLYNKTYQKAWF